MDSYPRFTEQEEFGPLAKCRYYHVIGANDIFNPHRHEFFEIFITVSGTVIHWINGTTKRLPEGSLVFIRPDDLHGYIYDDPKSSETVYVNLSFSRGFLQSLFAYLSDSSFPAEKLLASPMPPTVLLHKAQKDRLVAQIGELNTLDSQNKEALNLRMHAVLADIFVRFFADLPNSSHSEIPIWLTRLLSEMERPENFTAGREKMAQLSRKSHEHLSRSMKKYYGLTPTEYINALRINYASNLLLNTNTPIIDICYTSGFQSLSNFYKAFDKTYHMSPSAFRKKYK